MATSRKVPITQRALIQRINRALAKEGEALRTTRGSAYNSDLGTYYVVDLTRNYVVAAHVDIERLGKELNVIKPYERPTKPVVAPKTVMLAGIGLSHDELAQVLDVTPRTVANRLQNGLKVLAAKRRRSAAAGRAHRLPKAPRKKS